MSVSKIIHGVKSTITRKINVITGDKNKLWQRSFHDHIIRNEGSLSEIREYIANNPAKWDEDKENKKNITTHCTGQKLRFCQ